MGSETCILATPRWRYRVCMRQLLNTTYHTARKVVVASVGGTVVLVGLVMLVTPGPAFLVIPAGLAILALEFAFARRWLQYLKARAASITHRSPTPKEPGSGSTN